MTRAGPLGSPELLLIEDDEADVKLVELALSRTGRPCRLRRVSDADEALHYLRGEPPFTRPHRPDVVLLDYHLPGKSGSECLREIRADDRLRLIPVIVLSNSGADIDVTASYGLGANAFVVKPSGLHDFIAALDATLAFFLDTARLAPGDARHKATIP